MDLAAKQLSFLDQIVAYLSGVRGSFLFHCSNLLVLLRLLLYTPRDSVQSFASWRSTALGLPGVMRRLETTCKEHSDATHALPTVHLHGLIHACMYQTHSTKPVAALP